MTTSRGSAPLAAIASRRREQRVEGRRTVAPARRRRRAARPPVRAAVEASITACGRAEAASSARADFAADAGRLEQAQPRRELVAIDHVGVAGGDEVAALGQEEAGSAWPEAGRCPRVYGWVKRSPGVTGSFTDRISAYDMRSKTRNTNRTP